MGTQSLRWPVSIGHGTGSNPRCTGCFQVVGGIAHHQCLDGSHAELIQNIPNAVRRWFEWIFVGLGAYRQVEVGI